MNSLDEVLPEIKAISESIQDILADIKINTGNKNRQTIQENKTKLRQIARKLKELKKSLIPFYHAKPTNMGKIPIKDFKPAKSNLPPLPKQKETIQTKLNLEKGLIKRKY